MLEIIAPGFVYSIAKDALGWLRGRRRLLTPAQRVELRTKWKPLFDAEIWKNHSRQLRKDVIIRDMRRIDSYPDLEERSKGISPWFRSALVGTYHRGIILALRYGKLVGDQNETGWRYVNNEADEPGAGVRVVLVGRIPFDNIENVSWEGDEYYGYPHIFCFFDRKGEPYEALMFAEEKCNPGGLPFYTDLAPYEAVRKVSLALGMPESF